MCERRKNTRHQASIKLFISDLFRQEEYGIYNLNTPVKVDQISRGGLSFVSDCVLPVDYYFHADICSQNNPYSTISTTLKIVRSEITDRTHCRYGCKFIDLTDEQWELLSHDVSSVRL